jgi:16S rRNA (cytidine1402-2'-O)-methyltransferase
MIGEARPLSAGLYLVATPIGSARDITLRALDILAAADVLAAEDTRTLRHLMEIHGVPLGDRRMIAYHDHNGAEARPRLLQALAEGRSVAYASEAGTPLIADPGYDLARVAAEAGHLVTAAPGASAVLAALTVAGLPTDRFMFAGFAPPAQAARRSWLGKLAATEATLVLYESPRRIHETLDDLCDIFGGDRRAALCRELTKNFEEVRRGTLAGIRAQIAGAEVKGEVVIVIDRGAGRTTSRQDVIDALRAARADLSLKDAAAVVAEATGWARRDVYQLALGLKDAE